MMPNHMANMPIAIPANRGTNHLWQTGISSCLLAAPCSEETVSHMGKAQSSRGKETGAFKSQVTNEDTKTVRKAGAEIIVASASSSDADAGAVTIIFPTWKPKNISPSFVKGQPTDIKIQWRNGRQFKDLKHLFMINPSL